MVATNLRECVRTNLRGVVIATATGLTITAAHAQTSPQGPECGQFDLISPGDDRVAVFVDTPPEGGSAGDMRIGHRSLTTADGTQVGLFRWVATDLEPSDSEQRSVGHLKSFMILPGGVLIYEHVYEPNSYMDVSRSSTSEGTRFITGGTGIYNNASGTILVTKNEGLMETYSFDISCDE